MLAGVPMRDIDTHYSLVDVLNHNEALDIQAEADNEARERAQDKSRG